MHSDTWSNPALTIALALAAGMVAHALARHLKVPGIVLLLGAGVLLGPDLLDVVRPAVLGASLHDLVGFAVGVILFDGGMNLNLERLRRQARSIRQLVTVGALVTAVGGALAARGIMNWSWTASILFGTLVMVTGPTVITPLLRRIKVVPRVATVLEAEGVLVDAIGAIVAVVALEIAIGPPGRAVAFGAWHVLSRLAFGSLFGALGGFALAALLRFKRAIPEGLESVFTLAVVLLLYQGSNAIVGETGIVTAVVAGLVVGNARVHVVAELREFKEQLSVMLIGLLFVLLAADVRMGDVLALGWAGVGLVAALIFVIRPLNVLAGTVGSDLTRRERAFLCWLAPRGIVAAAVSSLFAQTLAEEGIAGGTELRAMVFLVIAATVLLQGLSGGLVASFLGVRRLSDRGYVILGANPLGRALARVLGEGGDEVVLIDSNPQACRRAEEEGFPALYGSGLDRGIQERAELDTRAGCLGITTNEEVNLLFARQAKKDFKVPRAWVALRRSHLGINQEAVQRFGGHLLFGEPQEVDLWMLRLEQGEATVESWAYDGEKPTSQLVDRDLDLRLLPLAVRRGRSALPVDEELSFQKGDLLVLAVAHEGRAEVLKLLSGRGWSPAVPKGSPQQLALPVR
jgi:NhaP-type Na+/H+ or K+/H+ antiporter/Trk K+ transport system NAD-binding subunit